MNKKPLFPLCYRDSTVNAIDFDAYSDGMLLTSEAINFYLEHFTFIRSQREIEKKLMNVFLMNPSLGQVLLFEDDFDDLKSSLRKIPPLLSYDLIAVAVNDSIDFDTPSSGSHWTLLLFAKSDSSFVYFDSVIGCMLANAQRIARKILALVHDDETKLNESVEILAIKDV